METALASVLIKTEKPEGTTWIVKLSKAALQRNMMMKIRECRRQRGRLHLLPALPGLYQQMELPHQIYGAFTTMENITIRMMMFFLASQALVHLATYTGSRP